MTSKEIREKYLEFFKERGHVVIPSASLIPENDSSSLFTSSGMQPLVPYLMGETHPDGVRLVNSQKSFRSGDIDEVGDNRHNTFFEMLGNWSLGDYFKKNQLRWFFEFLTKEIKRPTSLASLGLRILFCLVNISSIFSGDLIMISSIFSCLIAMILSFRSFRSTFS